MSQPPNNVYARAGVDYAVLDDGKRLALAMALGTSAWLSPHGAAAIDRSRGEPAFVFTIGERTLALVLECLGTKSMIARQYEQLTGENRYRDIAYDTVAAIVNDVCCVGALPLVVNAYFATGSANWYSNPKHIRALLEGWREACDDARCAWGGGESPTLPGLVSAEDVELAGSCVGLLPEGREPLFGQDLAIGDEIVLVASNGLHANGASLVRQIAARLDNGLLTQIQDGVTLGDAVLAPSRQYADLVAELLAANVRVIYFSHITGHGFLKLMRPAAQLTYRIVNLPPAPAELAFIVQAAGMNPAEAYSTLNMGAGYAVYCRPGESDHIVSIANRLGHEATVAGYVEEGPRRVIIDPIDVTFTDDAFRLTPAAEPNANRPT
jgi:phosphoribosylformylglycinamidine cyclo-ligase